MNDDEPTIDDDVEPSGPLVHLRHPVDLLPCCGTSEPDPVETNAIDDVTCEACLATL